MSEPFVAEIRVFGFNFAPRGWAMCNGQLMPVSQNTALFSLLGTTYGGDGRSTFALPDLAGSAVMHPGRGPGLTSRRLGERGGVSTVTLTEAQLPSHMHGLNATDERGDSTTPVQGYFAGGTDMYHSDGATPLAEPALPNTGGSQAHNNMMPYLGMNFCMALVGLYPSRS